MQCFGKLSLREGAEQLHYKYTKDMQPSGTVVFGISLILCVTGVGISMHVANGKQSLGGFSCSSQCTFQNYANKKKEKYIRYHCWVLLQVLFFLQNCTGGLKYHIPAFLLTVLFLVQQLKG